MVGEKPRNVEQLSSLNAPTKEGTVEDIVQPKCGQQLKCLDVRIN